MIVEENVVLYRWSPRTKKLDIFENTQIGSEHEYVHHNNQGIITCHYRFGKLTKAFRANYKEGIPEIVTGPVFTVWLKDRNDKLAMDILRPVISLYARERIEDLELELARLKSEYRDYI